MTDRQKAFCEHFAETGNGAEAARAAGYSEKSARQQARRLLTNADILEYVRQLADEAARPRVATVLQTKAVLSDIMNDTTAKDTDRIRAGEVLLRAAGAFLHVRPGGDDEILAYGETSDGDVVIYVPAFEKAEDQEGDMNDFA